MCHNEYVIASEYLKSLFITLKQDIKKDYKKNNNMLTEHVI